MSLTRFFVFSNVLIACACLSMVGGRSARAQSDTNNNDNNGNINNNGENEDNGIRTAVQGPIQAADCNAHPPTVQILGLTIDVSNLVGDQNGDNSGSQHSPDAAQNNDGEHNDTGGGGGDHSCSSIVGMTARIGLNNDQAPLQTTSGELVGGYNDSIFVQGPIQSIDFKASTVTVLGLAISTITTNGNASPFVVDLKTLLIGDEITAILKSDKAPFEATAITVKNQDNEIDLNLTGDDNGDNNVDDGSVTECDFEEVVTTPVSTTPVGSLLTTSKSTTAAMRRQGAMQKTARKAVKKVYHFQKMIEGMKGTFALRGLPAGRAKITIRRGGKVVARKTVKITPHAAQTVAIQLHGTKSKK